jgi:hypothetical protein
MVRALNCAVDVEREIAIVRPDLFQRFPEPLSTAGADG